MRILTWNINSIRTLPQYHPWNTLKTLDAMLNHLEADIVNFQEMKSSRTSLPKEVAIPPGYNSFFSFPAQKGGYSGVATYTKTSSVTPRKAEEGLTGLLQPKPPLSADERVSRSTCYPPYASGDLDDLDYNNLDSEGRTVVLDFDLFVLINVYCPNDGTGSDQRIQYKNDFHRLLRERVRLLVEVEKREVIVVGDLNACAAVEDHCEGEILVQRGKAEGLEGEDGFFITYYARQWLKSWLQSETNPKGMVDITRRFWPGRKDMYTCWNTKISARESNYGTRIDYVLATPGLLPWIKGSDIMPSIKGSDHCPVYLDLHDEIEVDEVKVKLKDLMSSEREPPRTAARFWDEYSGKQKVLDSFFGKKGATPAPPPIPIASSSSTLSTETLPTTFKRKTSPTIDTSPEKKLKPNSPGPKASTSTASSSKTKPKKTTKDETVPKQVKLSTFFSKGKAKGEDEDIGAVDVDADYRFALSLQSSESEPEPIKSLSHSPSSSSKASAQSWSTILAPLQKPLCTIHQEPAKELKVTKAGPNKNKSFWICARPVGPGYDKGRAERPRDEVDHRWKCDFFKWSSDVRKDMLKAAGK
ncbi:Endonuclease/exonuclease/phosphatase [Mycena floridula]|nr:Endonuclease/exonuclease/phosphatase [Mycena floridula]